MPLGYDSQTQVVALGDTAKLHAWLVDNDDQPYSFDSLVDVVFNVQSPDGTRNTYQGQINEDGSGFFPFNETTQVGHYVVVATFTLFDGSLKSTRANFECQDPFEEPLYYPQDEVEAVAQGVWRKISSCFDSSDGGPWLREMTLRTFNPASMAEFIDEAIMDFNMRQPTSSLTLADFASSADYITTPNANFQLIVEGTFIAVIRHLMRSYVEQPNAAGGEAFSWSDRRDYQLRWKQIYDVEQEMYNRWVSFAKRGMFGFGHTATSVFSYSRSAAMMGGKARGLYPWLGW
jgi:hypothetical protein